MGHAPITDRQLKVLLVDPVLFTGPYDAALSRGLESCGVTTRWATRALRPGEEPDLIGNSVADIFYPLTDGPARGRHPALGRLFKGFEHKMGLDATVRLASKEHFDLVHLQWCVVPMLDLRAIAKIRALRPVVLTVHDLVPFNGKNVSRFQRAGFNDVLNAVDQLIVHTEAARAVLEQQGIDPESVSVVPHGILPLGDAPYSSGQTRARWQIVMFGRLQTYKGLDVLVEAIRLLPPDVRDKIEVIVAGEPLMEMGGLVEQASGLGDAIRFDLRRFGNDEMAALLRSADCFVFPYRAIEASGVLHLVAHLEKWIVASDLGAFRDMIGADGRSGRLLPPGNAPALAAAMAESVGRRPEAPIGHDVPGWNEIGRMTRAIYEQALSQRADAVRMAA